MGAETEYSFHIDRFTPKTLPLDRLHAYLTDLVKVFGSPKGVHFLSVDEGSAAPRFVVDGDADNLVRLRLTQIGSGTGPKDAREAFLRLNRKLRDDGTSAMILRGDQKILEFRGVKDADVVFGPIKEQGHLDGLVVCLRGKDDTISIHLQDADGTIHHCEAREELAHNIAPFFRTSPIRVFGTGVWMRTTQGWELKGFKIDSFDVLERDDLNKVLESLRAIRTGLDQVQDLQAKLLDLRHGSDEVH